MVLHTYLLCLVVAGSIHFHSHLKDMRDFSLFINKPTDSDAAASSVVEVEFSLFIYPLGPFIATGYPLSLS